MAGKTLQMIGITEGSYKLSSQMTIALAADAGLLSARTTRAIRLFYGIVSIPLLHSHGGIPHLQAKLVSVAVAIAIDEGGIGCSVRGGVIC